MGVACGAFGCLTDGLLWRWRFSQGLIGTVMLRAGFDSLRTVPCEHVQPQRGRKVPVLPVSINLRDEPV